ncbi:MAG: hypothetical protein WC614_10865 [bacterium]
MYAFLWIAVAVLVGSLIIYAFQKELTQLVSKVLDLVKGLLETSESKLGVAVTKVSRSLKGVLPFMVYVFAFGIAFVGIVSSCVDFSLIKFSVNVIGLANTTLFHTNHGNVSAASAVALFIVMMEWILGYLNNEKTKRERQNDGQSKAKPSGFLLAFIGIVVVSAFLTFERVIEMEAGTRVPIVGAFRGAPVELLAFISAFLTILTAITIYWTSPSLDIALHGLMFLVVIVVIVVLSVLRGMTWLVLKLIEGLRPILLIITDLLSKIGKFIVSGLKSAKKRNKTVSNVLIPVVIATSVLTSGCISTPANSGKTEIVVILDTSYSFKSLLGKAVKKCEEIIDSLSPGSEFIAISINASSYQQLDELAYVKIPSDETDREKYCKSANAEYTERISKIKQPAIDNLKKVITAKSSPKTDIWGSIAYSSSLFSDSTAKRILIILSDILDNVGTDSDSCDFRGVKVWVLFVIHTDSPSEYKKRISQYEEYFIKHNASSIEFFDPIRSSAIDVNEILEINKEEQ